MIRCNIVISLQSPAVFLWDIAVPNWKMLNKLNGIYAVLHCVGIRLRTIQHEKLELLSALLTTKRKRK